MMSSNVKNQKVNMNSIFWLKKKRKKEETNPIRRHGPLG